MYGPQEPRNSEEDLYQYSQNKGADLRLVFPYAKSRFSHDRAQIVVVVVLGFTALGHISDQIMCSQFLGRTQRGSLTILSAHF